MKAVESIVHLRREQPRKLRNMVPAHVWALAAQYGLSPRPEERPPASAAPPSPRS
jgi:coenzyme F420 hydrogenase subunit beta